MRLKLWTTWEIAFDEKQENGLREKDHLSMEQWEDLFQKALETALTEEKVQSDVEVELNIVDDEAIHEMNAEYRKVDRATDVLSFPLCNLVIGHAEEQLHNEDKDPETGCVMLGNIVLSWDHVRAQSEEFNHSIRREAVFLIIHSILHLLGYDHMEEEEEKVMIEKQKIIMEQLQLTRND